VIDSNNWLLLSRSLKVAYLAIDAAVVVTDANNTVISGVKSGSLRFVQNLRPR
jgi:hypothetical protein